MTTTAPAHNAPFAPFSALVTGASGYLGTALCAALRARGCTLVTLSSKDCDLTQQGALERLHDQRGWPAFDVVYHLAAWTQAGDFCLRHPGEQWIINQQLNTNTINYWHTRQRHALLVSIGTSCAYPCDMDLVEDNYLDGTPEPSLYTYAMTKRMVYVGLLALAKQFSTNHLVLIPSTLYGPGYHTDGRQMHFIFDLIRKILRGKLFSEPVTLWGDGHQTRELIHVDDFVAAALALTHARRTNAIGNDLINVGSGVEHSIRDFAAMIGDAVGYDPALINYDTSKYVGARNKCLRIDKLQRIMASLGQPFEPLPLREGIAQTCRWFESHRDILLPPPPAALSR